MKKKKPLQETRPAPPETKAERQARERRERQQEITFDDDDDDEPPTESCGVPGVSQSVATMPAVCSVDRGKLLKEGMKK